MTPQLRNLLILLAGIAIVLIVVILLFSGNSRFMRFISRVLEEKENPPPPPQRPKQRHYNDINSNVNTEIQPSLQQSAEEIPDNSIPTTESYTASQKKSAESMVEMATLIQKSDDRLRIIESTGQEKLIDEYYELVFVTRKGQKLKIECSREAYEKIPFNQQGSLTYRRNKLVKFKYYEDIVYNS